VHGCPSIITFTAGIQLLPATQLQKAHILIKEKKKTFIFLISFSLIDRLRAIL
jgi:hypothetical protein